MKSIAQVADDPDVIWADPKAVSRVLKAVHSRDMRDELLLTPDQATGLIAEVVQDACPDFRRVRRVRKLEGGVVNHVFEFETDGDPQYFVAKLNTPAHGPQLKREYDTLCWYREHTQVPVPRPLSWLPATQTTDTVPSLTGLLMERVPGVNLMAARVSPRGQRVFQNQLAACLTHLHGHTAERYGDAIEGPQYEQWTDVFGPMLERELRAVADILPSRCRWVATEVLDHLDAWLPEQSRPQLIHSDLWSTNILVDDRHPDQPRINALIDCGATYADAEYELAYLSLFQTIDKQFMGVYGHKVQQGFERRCRVYWLNAMLLHVRLFGEQYVNGCTQITEQLRKLM